MVYLLAFHLLTLWAQCASLYLKIQRSRRILGYWTIHATTDEINKQPADFADRLQIFLTSDVSGGDCTISHIKLGRGLMRDREMRDVIWTLYCAAQHAALGGLCQDGTFILIDVGILRLCEVVAPGNLAHIKKVGNQKEQGSHK